MSLENTLHVLRAPVTALDEARQVPTYDYALTVAFVTFAGLAVILGFHRWLA